MLLAQARQLLTGPLHLPAQGRGLVLELLEGLVHFHEGRELVLELQRRVDLPAHILEERAQARRFLERRGDVGLRLPVTIHQRGRPLVETLELRRELRDCRRALLELREPRHDGVELGPDLHVRLAELLQALGGALNLAKQGFEALVLLLHLGDDGSHLDGQLPVLGAVPEQALEQGGHFTLLRTRRPKRP